MRKADANMDAYRATVEPARSKLVAHADLRAHLQQLTLGGCTEAEEREFWVNLQDFVSAAHEEAFGGPFEIDAAMPEGDGASLIHRLVDAADDQDLVEQEKGFLLRRINLRRYDKR